jgi:oxygen-independent coproporphyrinogen-3 oxidase
MREHNKYPYYMYRQKNILGNLENVGYCKPNFECIYNVQIMEEKQSIIAIGCGAVTKMVNLENNRIERIFNVKDVEEYIKRIDEMLIRKNKIYEYFS